MAFNMTNEEQNIAVAEWMGRKWWKHTKSNTFIFAAPDRTKESLDDDKMQWGQCDRPNPIPNHIILFGIVHDYGNDLNAMHEVEKKLNPIQEADYVEELAGMMMNTAYEGDPAYDASNLCSRDLNYKATAAQRREALLRAIGKYKEQKQ